MKNLFHKTDWTRQRKIACMVVLLTFCFGGVTTWGQTEDLEEAERLNNQLLQLHEQGKYAEAARLGERALAIREKTLGPEHPHTATSLENLAGVYKSMGNYEQALLLCQRALAIFKNTLGDEHPLTANSLNLLAVLYDNMGNYAQALPLSQQALRIFEKALGPEHSRTVMSLSTLAGIYESMGNYTQALPLYQRALAIREKTLGPEHPDTAGSLNDLAYLYSSMGNYTQALPLYQRALAIREKTLGPEHPDTANSLNNLAEMYKKMGDYAQALSLSQRALTIFEKVLGPEHPSTANSLNNLAQLYKSMGDYVQALPLYQRALAIAEKVLGSEHPNITNSLNNLAQLYESMGDHAHALSLSQRALTIREKTLGPEHPRTITSLNNLAGLYRDLGGYTQALPLYRRVLAIAEKTLGPEHPRTATFLNNVAAMHKHMGDYAQALPLYQRALAIKEKVLGLEHPDTATSLHNLAELYKSMEDYLHASPLYQRALAVAEKTLGLEHPRTATFLLSLAAMHQHMGDYEEALMFFRRGLKAEEYAITNVFAISSELQKLRFVEQFLAQYIAALSLLHRHFQQDPSAVRWGLEVVLRRKGIVLDAQARTQEALATHLTGESRQSWQRLTQHRSSLSRLILRGPGEQSSPDYRRAIDELQAAIAREEEFLAQHSGLVAQELSQRQVTVQRLVKHLPKDGALAELVRIRDWDEEKDQFSDIDRYLAFVLTPDDQVRLVDLGKANTVDSKIKEALMVVDASTFRADLVAYTRQADTKLAELYDLLLRPLESVLGSSRRLIVSPDGELSKVPFAALRTPDGRYLVEKMAVSYVASGRDLLRSASGEPAPVDLLLAANPAFDDRKALQQTALSEDAVRASDYGEEFTPLPGTAEEAKVIPPLLTGTRKILQGKEATESAVRSTKSPKVLHLATHGFFLKDEDLPPPESLLSAGGLGGGLERRRGGMKKVSAPVSNGRSTARMNPMVRSGLALAGANHAKEITTGDDGILTALEVSGMDLYGTDLVVLSACETGVGDVKVGEGVYGLRRAFVLAGAKNLVMSLWAVNDKITLEQMAEFYRGYAKGKSPAAALREAQLKSIATLREQTKATLGEPLAPVRLWAPFIIQQTAETGTDRTAEDMPPSLDTQATTPVIGGGEDRGRGGTQQLPLTGQTPRGQEPAPQESPLDTVSIEVQPLAGLAAYRWWNLVVPLLAVVGLFVLSRVHLNAVPTEVTETATTPVVKAVPPSVPYTRLVRRSPIAAVPPEIAFVHDEMLIGSGAECDVILRHPSIARQHARVQWKKQGYVIRDLHSPTGTYVNGRHIKENLLKDGWTVRLGDVEFVFHGTKPQP